MTVIITITASPTTSLGNNHYDYTSSDKIMKDKFNEYHIIHYSGQNKGLQDYKLLNAIKEKETFHIYYRSVQNKGYTYLGFTNDVVIKQNRQKHIGESTTPEERLMIGLHVHKSNIVDKELDPTSYSGPGKHKYAVRDHAKLPESYRMNFNLGFYCL